MSVRDVIVGNPVRVAAGVASLVVFAASLFGVVVDEQSVLNAVLLIVPLVVGGEVARSKVVPLTALEIPGQHHHLVAASDKVSAPQLSGQQS